MTPTYDDRGSFKVRLVQPLGTPPLGRKFIRLQLPPCNYDFC